MITPTLPGNASAAAQLQQHQEGTHKIIHTKLSGEQIKPQIISAPQDDEKAARIAQFFDEEVSAEQPNEGEGFGKIADVTPPVNPQSAQPSGGGRPASLSNVQEDPSVKAGVNGVSFTDATGTGMPLPRKKTPFTNEKYVELKKPELLHPLSYDRDLITTKIIVPYRKFKIPDVIEKPIDSYETKPWLDNNRSNISDYFNYGKSCQL